MRYVIVNDALEMFVSDEGTGEPEDRGQYTHDLAKAQVFPGYAEAAHALMYGEHVVAIDHVVLHGRGHVSPDPCAQ